MNLADLGEHVLGLGLDRRIQGQLYRLAVFGVANVAEADRVTERILDQPPLAVHPFEDAVLARFDPGQSFALVADRPDHL